MKQKKHLPGFHAAETAFDRMGMEAAARHLLKHELLALHRRYFPPSATRSAMKALRREKVATCSLIGVNGLRIL